MAKQHFHTVPPCAWSRPLGSVPKGCASHSPNRGVALGGFGAGSFMYNLSGSFGPWQSLDHVQYNGVWLDNAGFHFYEKPEGRQPLVKCLSADTGLKKAWEKLLPSEATYYALQPKGWVVYHAFQTRLSLKFMSPIIPHNYKETSYPVALFEFMAMNPLKKGIEIALMFTFPGVLIGAEKEEHDFKGTFRSKGDVKAVVLRSGNKTGEWCLATRQTGSWDVSFISNWDTEGPGQEVWDDFRMDGRLDDREGSSFQRTGAALAVKLLLKPGEIVKVPFTLTWDFPVVRFGSGTEWHKKYCEYFNYEGNNSLKLAEVSLKNYPRWEKEMDRWMAPVIKSPKYPGWLKCAAFNELYYSQFGGIFYSSGIRTKRDLGSLSKYKHLFFEMECMKYPFANTFDVRHYSSLPYVRFWPRIEKDLLMIFADAIMEKDPEHQTPHDIGHPKDDPFFRVDAYGTSKLHWKDLHSKFILQCWRYYYLYRDRKFLEHVWPGLRATYEYMKSTDKNKDHLPDNHGSDNTYDVWGLYGTSLLCGGLWVAALEAMGKMARIMNDEISEETASWLFKAKRSLDIQLWIKEKGYYRIDTESKNPTAIMSDGLNGQRYCETCGLEPILPVLKMRSHLRQVFERCVRPMKDYNHDRVGDVGAINGLSEKGESLGTEQSDEVWAGSTYFLSASMYHMGLRDEALRTAFGVYYTTYVNEETAYWFNTPEAWDKEGKRPRPDDPEQYQRARAVWELLLEIHDPYKKAKK